jgi:hypothetical protein
MWQTASSPASWSATAGPAGRRRAAPFTVGLARSFAQRASAHRAVAARRTVAASLLDWVSVVARELAAPGGVVDGKLFQGTDERASKGVWHSVAKSRATPGSAWHRGCGEHPAGSHGLEVKAPGGVGILKEERAKGLCWAGSKFHFLTTG